MKRLLISAALLAASPAFAADVDLLPYGYVAQAMRATQPQSAAAQAADSPGGYRAVGEAGIPDISAPSSAPRAQVIAEAREAARLGLLAQGEGEAVPATAQQEERIREAGLRAVGVRTASRQ